MACQLREIAMPLREIFLLIGEIFLSLREILARLLTGTRSLREIFLFLREIPDLIGEIISLVRGRAEPIREAVWPISGRPDSARWISNRLRWHRLSLP